jgi:hypothetical protein
MRTTMILACCAALAMSAHADTRANTLADWTARAEALAADQKLRPPEQARALAMLHVAMFEAVNAIDRRYAPFGPRLMTDRNTSREAAAASAGHTVLVSLYAGRRPDLDAFLLEQLRPIPEGPAKERGILLGRKAGADLLALRADDGYEARESWRPVTEPGVYIPAMIPVGSTVGGYKPWAMASAAQFRAAPPPSLTSETWTRDFNEIREMGGIDSKVRTSEQTTTGRFWFITGAVTYNPIIRQVAEAKKLDLVDCARVHALASMAAADAFIAVFEAKYHYDFWRPVTAVRDADQTGNPATLRDASWLPLGDTPMHPEYPCAHCISAAAVAAVLAGLYGNEFEISLTSSAVPGETHRWSKLSDYVDEVSNARVWAGFHYRFSTEAGKQMGRSIGELAITTRLKPRG